jgi:hypothetical protein
MRCFLSHALFLALFFMEIKNLRAQIHLLARIAQRAISEAQDMQADHSHIGLCCHIMGYLEYAR